MKVLIENNHVELHLDESELEGLKAVISTLDDSDFPYTKWTAFCDDRNKLGLKIVRVEK